jgi:O-antigen/teichoic acid export membrane protein
MLALAVAAVLLLLMFGQQLVGLLIGVRSKEAQELLLLVTIAVGLRILTTAPAAHLYVCGWFRRTLLIQIVGTLLAIGFAGILVPSTGLRGVGYAIVIAAAFRSTCIVLLYVRSHSKRDRPNQVQTQRSETAELPTAPVADAKAAVG